MDHTSCGSGKIFSQWGLSAKLYTQKLQMFSIMYCTSSTGSLLMPARKVKLLGFRSIYLHVRSVRRLHKD
jgi:hypothetical protein